MPAPTTSPLTSPFTAGAATRRSTDPGLRSGLFVRARRWSGLLAALPLAVSAQSFEIHDGTLKEHDLGPPTTIPGNPHLSTENHVAPCMRRCRLDNRCGGFTFTFQTPDRRGGTCQLKKVSRELLAQGAHLIGQLNGTIAQTGLKLYAQTNCWAGHGGNVKHCRVFSASSNVDARTTVRTMTCPAGTRPATIRHNVMPGTANLFCVMKLDRDPGGLPNCTDHFGGESRDHGVLGNEVNHACLDAQ